MRIILFTIFIFPALTIKSQNLDSLIEDSSYTELEEISISINSFDSEIKKQPQKVILIKSGETRLASTQTTAELLENTGEVYVQKSQSGGGSPVLRGFEANKILLMLDGVRLNNSITRGGHTQQVITVDNGILDRTEVLFGSGSVLYGTDALGGSINFYTKDPIIKTSKFKIDKGNFHLKTSSANFEKNTHAHFIYGNNKIAFLSSGSFSDFDDLRIGGNVHKKYSDWGKQFEYVEQIDGEDSIVYSDNPLKLKKYRLSPVQHLT